MHIFCAHIQLGRVETRTACEWHCSGRPAETFLRKCPNQKPAASTFGALPREAAFRAASLSIGGLFAALCRSAIRFLVPEGILLQRVQLQSRTARTIHGQQKLITDPGWMQTEDHKRVTVDHRCVPVGGKSNAKLRSYSHG